MFAPIKSMVFYGSNSIWYIDGGKSRTTIVLVCNCVSMSSKLNGRKVTRKYMRIAEKIKI